MALSFLYFIHVISNLNHATVLQTRSKHRKSITSSVTEWLTSFITSSFTSCVSYRTMESLLSSSVCPVVTYSAGKQKHPYSFGSVEMTKPVGNDRIIVKDGITVFYNDNIYEEPAKCLCCNSGKSSSETLITLATSMHFTTSSISLLNVTLSNWLLLRPFVQPVLYVTPEVAPSVTPDVTSKVTRPDVALILERACCDGWDVYIAPECNRDNLPVLRSIMADVKYRYNTPYVGFANGDIVFDGSLHSVLHYIHTVRERDKQDSLQRKKMLFAIGNRKNLEVIYCYKQREGLVGISFSWDSRPNNLLDHLHGFVLSLPSFLIIQCTKPRQRKMMPTVWCNHSVLLSMAGLRHC